MSERPPTPEELVHILSIRNAVEDREWSAALEQRLAEVLRCFAMARQRERQRDWRLEKSRRQQGATGGQKS